jgi:flagellar protein FliS
VGNQVFAQRYREAAINTATPLQLIVILYDTAICSLQEACEHIERNNIQARLRSVNRCISVISELQSSLDLENGGDIANSLNRLYDYMRKRIFAANVQQSPEPLKEIESLLKDLQLAWRKVAEGVREGTEISKPPDFPQPAVFGAAAPLAAMQIRSLNVSI